MDGSHPIRVTTEGDHQVVHLPRDMAVPVNAVVREEAGRLIIETEQPKALTQGERFAALFATWEPLEERIGPIEDTPPRPVDL